MNSNLKIPMHKTATNTDPSQTSSAALGEAPPARASLRQVAATMFWGLLMIGRKGTWERDGAIVSMKQVVVGAIIAGVLVVAALIALAQLVIRLAMQA